MDGPALPFEVYVREGMVVSPLPGDDYVTWALGIVNDMGKSELERVGAFYLLIGKGLEIKVSVHGAESAR